MNVARSRPRTWTPHIVLFTIVLHVVVVYYIAVAFKVVPPPEEFVEPYTFRAIALPPPPPPVDALEPEPIVEHPLFQQRPAQPPPIAATVSPLPPTAVPVLTGPASIDVQQQIQEAPIAQALPRYPRAAEERGIEGRVIMSITIMPDGSVRDIVVVSARPQGYFESVAVRAVQTWRYRPSNVTRRNVIVHMDFELRDT